MINNKSVIKKSTNSKSPECLSEDLRRCLRERALFHRQFYYRLSNDPETRSKLDKLSNQSSILLQNYSQNNTKSYSDIVSDQVYLNSINTNDQFHNTDNKNIDKDCTEPHKPLIVQSKLSYDLSTTNNDKIHTKQLPIQLNDISSEHVFKTCFNSTQTTPITNTLNPNNISNDVNNMSIVNKQKQQKLVMLPSLPNTLKKHENINTNQNVDVIKTNIKVLNNDHHNHTKNIMNQLTKNVLNDDITVIKDSENKSLSEDLMLINRDENIHYKIDTITTTIKSDNNIKYVSVVDKTKCNCDSVLDYFGVTDGDREACNNSDYSTILPATTINVNENINSEFKCLNSLKRASSSVLDSQISLSLLPSQRDKTNNNSLSSDLLSTTSVLSSSSALSFDKLTNCYSNSCSSSSSGSNSSCCCIINKDINKNENTINRTEQHNNCSEQVDSSDGIQVPKYISSNRTIFNQSLKDNNDGFLIKKRKRDLYRKFLKDQQKLENKNKLKIRRKYEENQNQDEYQFPCVENLIKMYTKLLQDKKTEGQLVNPENKMSDNDAKCKAGELNETKITGDEKSKEFQHQGSPVSDEGCLLGLSPYSSDNEDTETDGTRRIKEKVARSSSSDSALGLDEEVANIQLADQSESINSVQHKKGRRQTLTVADIPLRTALLPVAEPTQLPDSPTLQESSPNHLNALITQTAIPSKVLLEERVVEIPEDRFGSLSSSRRESAQSCMSDYNSSEFGGVRFVRTPSVVVSDYSDDVMCGITLEEIEYFRAQRMRRRSSADTATTEKDDACSDVSGSSSCSNLYYCGSTISALDGNECYVNGVRRKIDRKISDCSMCSTVSCDDDDDDDDFRKQEFQDQLNMDLNSQQQQNLDKDKQLIRKKVGN